MKHLRKFNEGKENKENDIIKNLDSDLSKIRRIISWASEEGSKKAFYKRLSKKTTTSLV